jgi:hypothetical protein
MSVITILKNDGKYAYEDYQGAKAPLRLNDLEKDMVHPIYRTVADGSPVAYMVSADWFDAKITGYAQAGDPLADFKLSQFSDDALSRELSTYIDLVNSHEQVLAQMPRFNRESTSVDQYLTCGFYNTKKFFVDDDTATVTVDNKQIGGVFRAYLLCPAQYDILNAAGPVDDRGKITILSPGPVPQTFTFTCISATIDNAVFSVSGSVTGAMPNLTVGVPYEQPEISLLLKDGNTDFVVADVYMLVLGSANL